MKYLKTYNQLNEGLRDKMTSVPDEKVIDIFSKSEPFDKILNGIKYMKLEFIKEGFGEIDKNIINKVKIIRIFNVIYPILEEDSKEVLEIIEYLTGLDVLKNQNLGWNGVIEVATEFNNLSIVKYLIGKNYGSERTLNNSIFSALYSRNYDIIKELLKSKKLNPFVQDGKRFQSPFNFLIEDIKKDDGEILELFLNHPEINKFYSKEEIEEIKELV